jgi:hypothetical protein
MEFQIIDETWSFWKNYGGKKGFGVKRGYNSKSRKDGLITSKIFFAPTKVSDKKIGEII